MSGVVVELAGRVHLALDDHAVDPAELRSAVVRRVLAVLALEQRAVTRHELGDAVWGEALPRTWETALRGAVHRLRRAAAAASPGRADVIRTTLGCYELDPSAQVDLLAASAAVTAADGLLRGGDPEAAAAAAEAAAAVLGRPLLAGLEGEWLDARRRRFAPLRTNALTLASAAAIARSDHQRSVAAAREAVAADPYLEAAHRQLMAACAAAGDRAAALVAYHRCRDLLADDLGVTPSVETEEVLRRLQRPDGPIAPRRLPASLDAALPLAGRRPELATLHRAWETVAAGGSEAVAVVGPAGVGKSRLAAAIAGLAHDDGGTALHGRFDPDAIGAFASFGEVLGQLGVAWPPPDLAGSGADRSLLFARATATLAAAAEDRPLVLVLDDAHWADRPSTALLAHLVAARLPRTLLVVTTRDDWDPAALAEVREAMATVDLGPLSRDETGALVTSWAGPATTPEAAEGIHERTGGNPFFVTVVLQDRADRRSAGVDPELATAAVAAEPPRSLAALLGAAIARSGAGADRVARAAAVLGDEVRPDVVAAVAGLAPGATRAALERLAHARIVGMAHPDPGRYRFVHALVRQTVLETTAAAERQALHRAAAEVLDGHPAAEPADVLRHLVAARHDRPRAVALAVEAGADLVERGAPEEAIGLLRPMLAWTRSADEDEARILFALAGAELALDRDVDGRRHLRQAAEIAVARGDASVLGRGVVLMRLPTVADHDPGAADVVRQVLALTEPGSALSISTRCWLAAEVAHRDEEEACTLTATALADARRLGDPGLHRLAALTWHLLGRASTHPRDRRSEMEAIRSLPHPSGKATSDISAAVFLAGDCLELGDRVGAEHAVRAAAEATATFGTTHLRWIALRNVVMFQALDGRLDEAEATLDEAGAIGLALGVPEAVLFTTFQLLAIRQQQGRLDELLPLVATAAATAPPHGPAPIVHGWMAALVDPGSAVATVDRAVEEALRFPRAAIWSSLMALAVEGGAAVGHERTGEVAGLLAPLAGRHVVSVTIAYLGAVDRYLGLAAAAIGDDEGARRLLDAAAAQHRATGSPFYLARSEAERAALGPDAPRRGQGVAGSQSTRGTSAQRRSRS